MLNGLPASWLPGVGWMIATPAFCPLVDKVLEICSKHNLLRETR